MSNVQCPMFNVQCSMSNVQCPILILNKKVLPFLSCKLFITKKMMMIGGKTTLALDVQATTQGPHSSHTNSICCNN